MFNNKRIMGVIPARGGSKGISRKNIQIIAGKPLIAWTIEESKKSKHLDLLILSSDDEEIIAIAKEWGCEVPFIRPKELALDSTPGVDPIIHAIRTIPNYDYYVMLQPTSPLRSAEDIDACIELCILQNANTCLSVTEPDKSPYWMYTLDEKLMMTPLIQSKESFVRRQNLPDVVALNGAVYVGRNEWLLENPRFVSNDAVGYTMPKLRSLDIDTELDLRIAEFVLLSQASQRNE